MLLELPLMAQRGEITMYIPLDDSFSSELVSLFIVRNTTYMYCLSQIQGWHPKTLGSWIFGFLAFTNWTSIMIYMCFLL